MPAQHDIELLLRLRQGDLTAFDELYLKYYKLLCTSAFFFLKSEPEAKDLVQSLFLDIWDKQLYVNFHDDVKGYLFRAIKNRCLNHLKRQKLQSEGNAGYAIFYDEMVGAGGDGRADSLRHVETVLEDMPGQKRAAIQMVYMHGKGYQDAANAMRISINSLKTHLKTGLKILRGEVNSKVHR
jgi:RNA polymerase sigma-70 factor (ECF subfamily)